MSALKTLLRLFSYLFHGLLALFLLGIASLALSSGQTLQLDMLPWEGKELTYWLFFGALLGLILVILAILRIWRPLFFVWTLAVLFLMVRGYFFSRYHFPSLPDVHRALLLVAGALLGAWGACFGWRRQPLR